MKKLYLFSFTQFFALFLFGQYTQTSDLNYPLVNNPEYKPGWTLVFQDEFNTSDNVLDTSIWNPRTGTYCGTKSYMDESKIYLQDNKYLVLDIEYVVGTMNCGGESETYYYKGSLMNTHDKTFGKKKYYEIRSKQPTGSQLHTGLFTFSEDATATATRSNICGNITNWDEPRGQWSEIDVDEHWNLSGSLLYNFHSNSHWVPDGSNTKYSCAVNQDISSNLPSINNDFYTVGTYWLDSELKWYLNNNIVRIKTDNVPQREGWLWLHNKSTGDINSDIPQSKWLIDYIRVYELNDDVKSPVSNYGISQGWTNQNVRPRYIVDINGDGKQDIIGFGYKYTEVNLSNCGSSSTSFGSIQYPLESFTVEQGWTNQQERPRLIADVNGDGRDDIIGFGYGGTYVSLSTSSSTSASFKTPQWVISNFTKEQDWTDIDTYPRLVGDVNGDGKDDIVGFGFGGVYVSISKSTSTSASFYNPVCIMGSFGTNAGWSSNNTHPRYLADVNGDGKDDIVGFGDEGVYVSISQSTSTTPSFYPPAEEIYTFKYEFDTEDNWIKRTILLNDIQILSSERKITYN